MKIKILIIIATICSFLLPIPASQAVTKCFTKDTGGTLTTGLVSYYQLSDTSDFYGTSTLVNNNSIVFDVTGKIGNAASSTDSNTNKTLSTSTNMGIDGTTTTISAWFKSGADPASGVFQVAVDLMSANTSVEYMLIYRNQAGTIKVQWDRGKYTVADQLVSTSTTLTAGTWYHLLLTYDGATVTGYLNGKSQGTVSASGNGATGGNSFAIMGRQFDGSGFAVGMVDETGVWNKVLTATEISDLYNSGDGSTMTTSCGSSGVGEGSILNIIYQAIFYGTTIN